MSPEINAISTVALVLTAAIGVWAERFTRKVKKGKECSIRQQIIISLVVLRICELTRVIPQPRLDSHENNIVSSRSLLKIYLDNVFSSRERAKRERTSHVSHILTGTTV